MGWTSGSDGLARENTYLREQRQALAEVLRAVARSEGLQPVLDEIVTAAVRLCRAEHGQLYLADGNVFRIVADQGGETPESFDYALARSARNPPYAPAA
jgi:hypothetical protein